MAACSHKLDYTNCEELQHITCLKIGMSYVWLFAFTVLGIQLDSFNCYE